MKFGKLLGRVEVGFSSKEGRRLNVYKVVWTLGSHEASVFREKGLALESETWHAPRGCGTSHSACSVEKRFWRDRDGVGVGADGTPANTNSGQCPLLT